MLINNDFLKIFLPLILIYLLDEATMNLTTNSSVVSSEENPINLYVAGKNNIK